MMSPRKARRRRSRLSYGEDLESRTLLSATVADGVLSITGTEEADRISVRADGDDLLVSINGDESTFVSADVTSIDVTAGAGNDRVVLRGVEQSATIDGGAGNDRLSGGKGNDVILGGDGNDRLLGRRGDDQLDGGAGRDALNGGGGADILIGADGNDRLTGGRGDDNIDGGAGDDRINGQQGNDALKGGDGNDRIRGGRGDDVVEGEAGNDRLNGQSGADVVNGGDGDDTLTGDSSEDVLDGGAGENVIQDRPDAEGRPPGGPSEEQILERINAQIDRLFARVDANADGVLTIDEVSENHWTRLSEADADENGEVSRDELLAHIQARLEARATDGGQAEGGPQGPGGGLRRPPFGGGRRGPRQ